MLVATFWVKYDPQLLYNHRSEKLNYIGAGPSFPSDIHAIFGFASRSEVCSPQPKALFTTSGTKPYAAKRCLLISAFDLLRSLRTRFRQSPIPLATVTYSHLPCPLSPIAHHSTSTLSTTAEEIDKRASLGSRTTNSISNTFSASLILPRGDLGASHHLGLQPHARSAEDAMRLYSLVGQSPPGDPEPSLTRKRWLVVS